MARKASMTTGKPRRPRYAWSGLALFALTLAACNGPVGGQAPPEPGDKAVARVNGQTIWASDVKREAVAEGVIGPGDPLDVSSDQFRQVLDEVIDTRVLAGEALARGLDKDALGQRRLEAARERALEDLMVDSVVGKAVNKQAEDALYQEFLKNRTASEAIHLHQITLATLPDALAAKKELAGGANFEAVAMERSVDPETRFKGGDMGQTTTDTLPQALADAIKAAKPGDVVGPVKLDAGWAIVRVDDRQAEQPPSLEAVRPQLIRFITYDQIKDLVLTLRSHAHIENLLPPPPDVPGAPAEPASAPPEGAPPPANALAPLPPLPPGTTGPLGPPRNTVTP